MMVSGNKLSQIKTSIVQFYSYIIWPFLLYEQCRSLTAYFTIHNVFSHNHRNYSLSSSSSSSSLLIWKYLSSYASRAQATTRSQSRKLFFFRYFLVRYLRYLLEKGIDDIRTTLFFSRPSDTSLPKFPVLPSILIAPRRYFSNSPQFMIPSSTGLEQLMMNFRVVLFPLASTKRFLPLSFCLPIVTFLLFLALPFFASMAILKKVIEL